MLQLPSERQFLNRKELQVFTSGLTILVERAKAAAIGSVPFQRQAWPPELNDHVYADRERDPRFVELLRRLRAKLSKYPYGRFRFNVLELTALAFALRVLRLESKLPATAFQLLEDRIERARRRRRNAAVRKVGKDYMSAYRYHWLKFVHWCRFTLLYDWRFRDFRPQSLAHLPTHRQQLKEVREWIRELINQRCEAPISEEMLTWVARETKRRARRGRFGSSTEEILRDKPRFSEAIFGYVERRVALKVKIEARAPVFQMMHRGAQFGKSMKERALAIKRSASQLVPQPDSPPACTSSPAPVIDDPAPHLMNTQTDPAPHLTNTQTDPAPHLTNTQTKTEPSVHTPRVDEGQRKSLIAMVVEYLNKIDLSYRQLIANETIRQAPSYDAPARTKRPIPPKLLVLYGELPKDYDKQLYEEVDWLLYHLSRFVEIDEIASIVAEALPQALHPVEQRPIRAAV